jgi:O-antigen/teichoic acid export membrane protein
MSAIRKTFLSNLMLIIGLNLLIKPLYVLVIEAQVQDRVGPEQFGIYFALLNLSFIFNIIPDLGITNWNTRAVATSGIVESNRFNRLLGIRAILACSYIVICLTLAAWLHYEAMQLFMLMMLALNQILATGLQFMRSYIAGMHRFRADSILSVLDRALLALFMGTLLILQPSNAIFPIEYLIWGQTLAYGIAFCIAFIVVIRHKQPTLQSDSLRSIQILKDSAPYALLILLSMIANRQDGVLLERLHSQHAAGIYAMAYRIGDTLNMFSFLFAGLLLPMFTRQLQNKESIQSLFESSFHLLFVGAGIALTACFFYSEYLLQFIYSHHVSEAAAVLPWIMLSAFFFSMQYITGTLITASGQMRSLIFIALGGLVYNLILNLFYIPTQGAIGAAKAACFMQAIVWIAQAIQVQQRFDVFKRAMMLRSAAFLALSSTIAIIIQHMPWGKGIQLILTIIGATVIAIVFKMIHTTELLSALRTKASDDYQKH